MSRTLKVTFTKVLKAARGMPEVLLSHVVCKDMQSNNKLAVQTKILICTSILEGVACHLKLDV